MSLFETYYADGTTPVVGFRNTVPLDGVGPLVAFRALNNGQAVGDRKVDLTFASVSPGVTATATTKCASKSKNSQHNTQHGVALDESWVPNLYRGYEFQISSNLAFDSTWKASFFGGLPIPEMAAGNPLGVRHNYSLGPDLVVDSVPVGREGFLWSGFIKNTSEEPWTDGRFQLRPWATGQPINGVGLSFLDNVGWPVEKFADAPGQQTLPYVVTFHSYVAASAPNPARVGVRIDGQEFACVDTSNGEAVTSGSLKIGRIYQITSGALAGVQFTISASVTTADVYRIWIHDVRWTWIAPDVGGSPGTWTQDGFILSGSSAGEVAVGGMVKVWQKEVVPAGSPWKKAPHPAGGRVEVYLAGATGM